MALPTGLRAFAHRDYRLFWGGQLVSLIGTWMQSVGQSWLVLELTGSPFRLGMIGTLQFTPVLLFAFVGGALSDRVIKRRIILTTQTALMCQAFVMSALVWSGHVQYWHVAVLASLYGLANAFDMPARQSFVAELTGKEDLVSAIALNSMTFNGARVVGPAVAGLLIARYGTAAAFFVNGLSFLGVLAALLAIRAEGRPHPRARASIAADIKQGVAYAAGTPHIAIVFGLLLCISLFVVNFNVTVPLLARDVLGQGAHGFGLLMSALGTGAVTGALVLAALGGRRPSLSLVVAAAALVSIGMLALSLVGTFPAAVAVLFVTGLGQILFTSSCNSTVQIAVPDALRGRLMSLYALVFVGVTPFGAFLMGTLAEHLGVSKACAIGGGAGLVSVLAMSWLWRRRQRTTSRAPA